MERRNTILQGDALTRLRELDDASVDSVITSPPFYGLRDYNVAGQIGLEDTVDAWVEALRPVFAEIARILKPTGSVWVDLADTFSRHADSGAPVKSLLLAPERFILAMVQDGFRIRGKVIWAKTNPMPYAVTDRLNTTYDVLFHLVKSPHYFFDLDVIRDPYVETGASTHPGPGHPAGWVGRNPGDVWRLPVANFRGAHFATFPDALVERPLLASCPEAICTACGQAWQREVTVRRIENRASPRSRRSRQLRPGDVRVRRYPRAWRTIRRIGDLQPCGCNAPTVPGLVLDPFFGAGTVGVVAERHGRSWLGIELNADYVALATKRIESARSQAPPPTR